MRSSSAIRSRRHHSPEFKQELVGLCQPGASISGVALAHGVNANLLRRWINAAAVKAVPSGETRSGKLVPVQVEASSSVAPGVNIQFEIQRGATLINIRWPVAEAQACAQWLGDWIK
jgi:transposase